MKSWWEFLTSPRGRAAMWSAALVTLSMWLPALAVQRVILAVAGHGWAVQLFATVVGFVVAYRIGRWHDRQDKIERERARQTN